MISFLSSWVQLCALDGIESETVTSKIVCTYSAMTHNLFTLSLRNQRKRRLVNIQKDAHRRRRVR